MPPGVVTVTFTTPALFGGDTVVILVSDTTVKLGAATLPKCTAVAPVKPVPVSVIALPPVVNPDGGATLVTVNFGTLTVVVAVCVVPSVLCTVVVTTNEPAAV